MVAEGESVSPITKVSNFRRERRRKEFGGNFHAEI
jgi:hypothetical protein